MVVGRLAGSSRGEACIDGDNREESISPQEGGGCAAPIAYVLFVNGVGGEEVWSWEGRVEVVGVGRESELGEGTCSMDKCPSLEVVRRVS